MHTCENPPIKQTENALSGHSLIVSNIFMQVIMITVIIKEMAQKAKCLLC